MVARGRTKNRDEYKPHLASVLTVGPLSADASFIDSSGVKALLVALTDAR